MHAVWKIRLSQQPQATVGELWLWLKTGPPPVSVNKVLLEHSHAHLFTHSKAAFTGQEQLSNCNTTWPAKPKHLLSDPLQKNFAGSRLKY